MDTKNKLIKVKGVIIKEVNFNEYDKLLTLLSKELGKIQVYAFGVRRKNSKNIGTTRVLTFAEFDIRVSNEKYTLELISNPKIFEKLIGDYDKVCKAFDLIKICEYFSMENKDASDEVELLYYAIKAIEQGKISEKLIIRVYELKMLVFEGIYKTSSKLNIDNEVIKYTWDFVINTSPNKLFSFMLKDDIENKFNELVMKEMIENMN